MSKSNEEIFKDYILEKECELISKDWIIWMLDFIDAANKDDATINPEWLRATHEFSPTQHIEEPLMTIPSKL